MNDAAADIHEARGTRQRSPGLWEAVCQALQKEIILGRLKPRERLVEDDLISRYAVTRHAVRRAFDELERLGLVVREPNRGIKVRDYTVQEAEELYEIRDVLERAAIARMPLPGSAELIEALTETAAAHEAAAEEERFLDFFQLNNEFHETFYAACGSQRLCEAIKHYTFATRPIRSSIFHDRDYRRVVVDEHRQMIKAVQKADRDGLLALCVQHIRRPKDHYLQSVLA